MECHKSRFNAGLPSDLYYFRDSKGNEVDLLMQSARKLKAVEIKSAMTFKAGQLKGIRRFKSLAPNLGAGYLVYNGRPHALSDGVTVLNYRDCHQIENET